MGEGGSALIDNAVGAHAAKTTGAVADIGQIDTIGKHASAHGAGPRRQGRITTNLTGGTGSIGNRSATGWSHTGTTRANLRRRADAARKLTAARRNLAGGGRGRRKTLLADGTWAIGEVDTTLIVNTSAAEAHLATGAGAVGNRAATGCRCASPTHAGEARSADAAGIQRAAGLWHTVAASADFVGRARTTGILDAARRGLTRLAHTQHTDRTRSRRKNGAAPENLTATRDAALTRGAIAQGRPHTTIREPTDSTVALEIGAASTVRIV